MLGFLCDTGFSDCTNAGFRFAAVMCIMLGSLFMMLGMYGCGQVSGYLSLFSFQVMMHSLFRKWRQNHQQACFLLQLPIESDESDFIPHESVSMDLDQTLKFSERADFERGMSFDVRGH